MRKTLHALLAAAPSLPFALHAQRPLDSILPVRGFCIDLPQHGVAIFREAYQRIDSLGN